jgi:hypothetical protein
MKEVGPEHPERKRVHRLHRPHHVPMKEREPGAQRGAAPKGSTRER